LKRLAGIIAGLALAASLTAYFAAATIGAAAPNPRLYYDVIPNDEKMASSQFIASAMHDDSYLLFGSSELGAGAFEMSQHPCLFFRERNIGYSPMLVGSAHTQSLQFAIYAGALASKAPNNKLALIVSPQWFQSADMEPQAFRSRFSWDVYREFLDSGLDPGLKSAVEARLREFGVDEARLAAASTASANPIDAINGACFGLIDDVQTSRKLGVALGLGYASGTQTQPLEHPDWPALLAQADADGAAKSGNNPFGIDNAYFDAYIGDASQYVGTDAGVSYLDSREYGDLALFLDVCANQGLEPLIVIAPVNGLWYGHTGMSEAMRQQYYAKLRALCDAHGASYLDLSAYEDEKYLMRDVMHLGWRGWLYVEKGFYEFIQD
jgi:D-alanine transfer protein